MKTKETAVQDNRELKDEELKDVNGGMKIVLTKTPKFFAPILRLIYRIKKKDDD